MQVHYDGLGGGMERIDPINVLILGGWSTDPLDSLRRKFRSECIFYEPTLFMPPVDCASLFMWESLVIAGAIALIIFLTSVSLMGMPLWLRLSLAVAVALTLPRLISLVARGAIRRSVDIAAAAIEKHSIDVVVGYSWGGGIACWLWAEGQWRGATLLLAPTLHAMASAAWLQRPTPFFVPAHAGRPAELDVVSTDDDCSQVDEEHGRALAAGTTGPSASTVHIFHADDDGFCPESQRHDLQQTGARCETLRDTHDLMAERSEEAIRQAFADLIMRVRPEWEPAVDCVAGSSGFGLAWRLP